jgi:hypothetical protein
MIAINVIVMDKCFRYCFKCFGAFKVKRNSQIRIEATQLNNSFNFKHSASQPVEDEVKPETTEKTLKRFPSPFKSTIMTGKCMKSARPAEYFWPNENLENISGISKKSDVQDLTPIRIPSPIIKKDDRKIAPVIFSPRDEGKLPKLFLAIPRNRYPRSKSIQIYKKSQEFVLDEVPKEGN